jgi:hypothetical protein
MQAGDVSIIDYSWWYNWGPSAGDENSVGKEFIPMIWGRGNLAQTTLDQLPTSASAILGFNEPNMRKQANMTPAEACDLWPQLEAAAERIGASLGSPGVNHCKPASGYAPQSGCSEDPFDWLLEFTEACPSARMDFIHTHYYGCNATAVIDYVTALSNSFSRPVWLTEFSCPSNTVARTLEYMQEILPLLEALPTSILARYAWFAQRTNPTSIQQNCSLLVDGSTELTEIGSYYSSGALLTEKKQILV